MDDQKDITREVVESEGEQERIKQMKTIRNAVASIPGHMLLPFSHVAGSEEDVAIICQGEGKEAKEVAQAAYDITK